MNAVDALVRIRGLGMPVIKTADAAVALGESTGAASYTLTRLGRAGLITRLRHGVWWVEPQLERLRLPEFLSAPYPSYVSLQTALHYHGLIEQIPEIVYVATLTRTQRVKTSAGVFSLHHLAPEVFGGFAERDDGAKIATPEKALFDVAYLSAGKSRLFTNLPELELSRRFRHRELKVWLNKIPSERSRTITERKLDEFVRMAERRVA